mgnify:CR=1 FL=1
MKTKDIVFYSTLTVFSLEAILHYNIGKNGDREKGKFYFPNSEEFIKLIGVVVVFSYINGVVVSKISKM